MADRMRSLAKRSGSKLAISKGSMNHIGTTPFKYKIDIFFSYAEGVKSATDVCVTLERRGKTESTPVVKVKDKKAIFKHTLTLETTLFRKNTKEGKGGTSPSNDVPKFDEKIAKVALRKGGPDGKAIGKLHMNLADHIKGPSSTVFAELKLNNDSVIVAKIESTLLHSGRKKGHDGDSEKYSEMTEADGPMENDSIFGDDATDHGDLDLLIDDATAGQSESSLKLKSPRANAELSNSFTSQSSGSSRRGEKELSAKPLLTSRISEERVHSTDESSVALSPKSVDDKREVERKDSKPGKSSKPKLSKVEQKSEEKPSKPQPGSLVESPSIRDKIKLKMKGEKSSSKREKTRKDEKSSSSSSSAHGAALSRAAAEVAELKSTLAVLTNENKKLKSAKQAMMDEIDELRAELDAAERASDGPTSHGKGGFQNDGGAADAKLRQRNIELSEKIRELEGQVEGLLDELDSSPMATRESGESNDTEHYQKKIEDLEIALKREPQYLDVVDELKVTKMALALANMEKEQAVFSLRQYEANLKTLHANTSPVSQESTSEATTSRSGWGVGLF